ncbi:NADH-quinone oxidoreductase subunit M [Alphaproteobacteria bacterium]|nr:NADH-quinone oxidoreductase subunit M [Alphaproteobacteria bacterium]
MYLENIPFLSILIFLPVLGSFFISMIDKNVSPMNTRYVGLWVTGTVFVMTLFLALYMPCQAGFHFMDRFVITQKLGLEYLVGIDGLSLPFIVMTAFIFPLAILASWDKEIKNLKFFVSLLLILETLVLGSFCSLNLLVFYIFFESVLVPIYFLTSMHSLNNKLDVAFKNVLYTLFGSIFLLVSILKIFEVTGTFSFIDVVKFNFSYAVEVFLFLGFLISFIIKVPIIPFHTWLPNMHGDSSTPISMVVSGAAFKLSIYGILRFVLFLFPQALQEFAPWLQGACLVSFLYAAFVAYDQKYVRRLLSYLSISYLSFSLAGIFSLNSMAMVGGIFHIFVHSLLFPAAFYITGLLHMRLNTDRIKFYGGIGQVMPQFSILLFLICLALVGIPGSSSFIGNFLIMGSLSKLHISQGVVSILGFFFYGVSLFWLYRRIVFGVITEAMVRGLKDLNMREKSIAGFFIFLIFIVGLVPSFPLNFSKFFSKEVTALLKKKGEVK